MPATVEEEWTYWDKQATELRRGQLKAVQTSATKWAALLTALLGVFGTVAFAGGLSAIDDLGSPWAGWVKALTTIAAVLAIIAISCLSYTAGGLRLTTAGALNGTLLKQQNTALTRRALISLDVGRWCAVLTALAVLAGSFVVLWAPAAETPASRVIARFSDASYCGRPTLSTSGKDLQLGGRNLSEAAEVVPVADCP